MDIIKTAKPPSERRVLVLEVDDLSNRFDDVRDALESANNYFKTEDKTPNPFVMQFYNEATEVERAIKNAIYSLGSPDEEKLVKESIDAYNKALDGFSFIGKFCLRWKNICPRKVRKVFNNQS